MLVLTILVAVILLFVVLPGLYVASGPWRRSRAYDAAEGKVLPCPDDYDPKICDTLTFVQKNRGRSFRWNPEINLIEEDEFLAEVRKSGYVDEIALEESTLLFASLGLIGQDVDLFEVEDTRGAESVSGFYNFDSQEITIRGTELNPFVLEILAHELSHAYDDQWLVGSTIPLAPPTGFLDSREKSYVRLVVYEGAAELVARDWLAAQSEEDKQEYDDVATEFSEQVADRSDDGEAPTLGGVAERGSSKVWSDHQRYPYVEGPSLVEELTENYDSLDALVKDPPETSERALHPDILGDDDPPINDLPIGGPNDSDYVDVLGELQLSYVLGVEAAEGWDGDIYNVWDDGGEACISLTVAAETDKDLAEMVAAAERWAEALPERSASTIVDEQHELLRMANCDDG